MEKLLEHVMDIKERLAAVETNLAEHMRRTKQNEDAIDELRRFKYLALGAIGVLGPVLSKAIEFILK